MSFFICSSCEFDSSSFIGKCPDCGEPLVLYTTAAGKKMKKCSTAGWDPAAKKATGCTYVEWLKGNANAKPTGGEEFLPPYPAL